MTKSYTDFVLSIASTSFHQPNPDLLHAAMGMCTELAEIYEVRDDAHELEELGDVVWYMALGFAAIGQRFEDAEIIPMDKFLETVRGDEALVSLLLLATDLLDLVKKQIFYGREYSDEKVLSILVQCKSALHHGLIVSGANITIDQVIEANVKKLSKRFSTGSFSEDAANNRDVNAEYAAMKA